MAIRFACRHCRQPLSVRRRQAGSPVICPRCKGETLAPSASECARPTPVAVPALPPAAIMGPPRLGILVPTPRPADAAPVLVEEPAAITASPPPIAPQPPSVPAKASPAAAKPVAPRRTRRKTRRFLVGFIACALLVGTAVLAYTFRPFSTPPAPADDELALALLPLEDDPGDLQGDLAAGEEEWLDERPAPNDPEDPRQPPAGPPPGIDIPPLPAKAVAPPPLPAPGSLARFKRRSDLNEGQLRQRLARAPEIGLERSLMPSLVWEYKEQQEVALTSWGTPDFEPRPLQDLYPGVKGLPLRHASEARLDPRRAATLDALSRKVRVYVSHFAPVDRQGKRPGAAQLRTVMYNEMRGRKPEWLRPEAVPVLMQMLTHEDGVLRHLLVEILSEIKHRTATAALAQRATCDLDADIRAFAIDALRFRPRDDYVDVLLRALRHPEPMLADHAAEALVALNAKEAVPALVMMLKEPDPSAPYPGKEGRLLVREVVRTNHLANCLLCHPPSVTYEDPVPGVIPNARWMYPVVQITSQAPTAQRLVSRVNSITSGTTSTGTTSQTGCHDYSASTGTVPNVTVPSSSPGSRSSRSGRPGASSRRFVRSAAPAQPGQPAQLRSVPQESVTVVNLPVLVRGDVTYLRQDFSVVQPVPDVVNGQPTTVEMRFDYLVRVRRATPDEAKVAREAGPRDDYEQRGAVLFALRELTGQDAGPASDAWQRLYPDAEADSQAQRLAADLARATGNARQAALERLRDGKGTVHTEALAAAAGRLDGEVQEKVRDALVQRLTRMTAATLRNKLSEENPEVRRAAALACAQKEDPAHVPDLMTRLEDADAAVARAARQALSALTGEEFKSSQQWKEWWQKQGTE
jgi:HEAT repeat protein